jgi:hypothetical protein
MLRPIDQYIIGLLATLGVVTGLYVAGPWYLFQTPEGTAGVMYSLLESVYATVAFGILLLGNSISLGVCVLRRGCNRKILGWNLFLAFLLRLYIFIGTLLVLESWRPPNYLSSGTVALVLAGYWIWVVRSEGTT